MPYKDAVEMLCDYLGAGRAYMGKDFTYKKECEWWLKKCEKPLAMHKNTKDFITHSLDQLTHGLDLQDIDLSWIYEYYEFRELTDEFNQALKETLNKGELNG